VTRQKLAVEIDEIVDQAEGAGELALLTGVTVATPVAVEMTEVLVRPPRGGLAVGIPGAPGGIPPYVVRIHEWE